jgi:menaquinone-dependent protoporphyrinogen oxidase
VVERIAAVIRAAGTDVEVVDIQRPYHIDLAGYTTACVAASVHLGRHERAAVDFVKAHRAELERLSAAFISVSLSEAGVENTRRSELERGQSAADVQRVIDHFIKETGWRPARVFPVAGALAFTRYNLLLRFVMKQIARKAGGPTDTSRDHELTDWAAVDRFASELVTR